MKTLFENERITIDFDDNENLYRISSFDKNTHYTDDIMLDEEQMNSLKQMFNEIELEFNNEFD